VDDPGILVDVDTAFDYESIVTEHRDGQS
jgi:hypothetical protein